MIDKKLNWSLYKKRLLSEIKNNPVALEEIKELGQLSQDQDVTLLCHCIGADKHCHRFVIRELVEKGNRG
jgi:uncharacterized protein YeaO (DUF488 family)